MERRLIGFMSCRENKARNRNEEEARRRQRRSEKASVLLAGNYMTSFCDFFFLRSFDCLILLRESACQLNLTQSQSEWARDNVILCE